MPCEMRALMKYADRCRRRYLLVTTASKKDEERSVVRESWNWWRDGSSSPGPRALGRVPSTAGSLSAVFGPPSRAVRSSQQAAGTHPPSGVSIKRGEAWEGRSKRSVSSRGTLTSCLEAGAAVPLRPLLLPNNTMFPCHACRTLSACGTRKDGQIVQVWIRYTYRVRQSLISSFLLLLWWTGTCVDHVPLERPDATESSLLF